MGARKVQTVVHAFRERPGRVHGVGGRVQEVLMGAQLKCLKDPECTLWSLNFIQSVAESHHLFVSR